ncbi:MAG: hypothetical protein QXS14_05590 [Desulfurococcaceae archaeon]
MRKKKGGARYKKIKLSLPKRLYMILNGVALGDERKLNRLIKGIIEDKLAESTVKELELYLSRLEEEPEEEETEEPSENSL